MLLSNPRSLHADGKSRLGSAAIMRFAEVGATTRILIVDHDRQVGVALSFMLATRRFEEVRAVRSAKRAVAVAEQFQPELVFLDLDLPDGGGIPVANQFVRDARKRRPRLIALTKNPEDPMYEQARAAGFERLLVKPVSHEELDKILGISRTA